jgi:hypothetical protein
MLDRGLGRGTIRFFYFIVRFEMKPHWPFDQGPRVAALTSRQVIEQGLPILSVVHYAEDEDWAFTCGTTDASEDMRVIAMEQALNIDQTLAEIAELPPGWGATRTVAGGSWTRYELAES